MYLGPRRHREPPPYPGPLPPEAYKPGLAEMAFRVSPAPSQDETQGAGPAQISALTYVMPSHPVPRGHQLIPGRPDVSGSLWGCLGKVGQRRPAKAEQLWEAG